MEQSFEPSPQENGCQELETDHIAQVDAMLRWLPYEEGLIYIGDLHQLCRAVDYDTLTHTEKELYHYVYSLSLEDF